MAFLGRVYCHPGTFRPNQGPQLPTCPPKAFQGSREALWLKVDRSMDRSMKTSGPLELQQHEDVADKDKLVLLTKMDLTEFWS